MRYIIYSHIADEAKLVFQLFPEKVFKNETVSMQAPY